MPRHSSMLRLCLVLGEIVDCPVGAVYIRPTQVGETESFFERGALDDLRSRVEQRAYVGRHHGKMCADDSRSTQAYRGTHHST